MGKNTPHIRPLWRDIGCGKIASGKMNTTPIILPDVHPFQRFAGGCYVYPRKVFSNLKSQRKPLYNGQNTPYVRPLLRDIGREI